MSKVKYKHFSALSCDEKIPRKAKKAILGLRMSGGLLRRRLRSIVKIADIKTMYERPDFNHGMFCPKCGCGAYHGTGNRTEYPEHWEKFYCLRCSHQVGLIDNSPFMHALEFGPEFEIDF